jgi:hypothetical protein
MFQMIGVFAELERAVIREAGVSCAVCQLTSFHLEIEELACQSQIGVVLLSNGAYAVSMP